MFVHSPNKKSCSFTDGVVTVSESYHAADNSDDAVLYCTYSVLTGLYPAWAERSHV